MKAGKVPVGAFFIDPDGDKSVMLGMKEREVGYGNAKPVKSRFYNTVNEKGKHVCIACTIPSKTEVELCDE